MGDVFPRLGPKNTEMERELPLLSAAMERRLGPPTTPALVVHVEIQFTDPVIRSRYCRSYGSSPSFEPTNRLCRGLVRRIERCSEELLTRKDSGALEMFKDGSYERKPRRFEMTFRITRRDLGEWAERTYRSYQKQPLTVALTKEILLASHRIIGLFLRRHDEHFRWLACPVPDADFDVSEAAVPSRNGPPSLLSIPKCRFIEATQAFELVPGYSIELCFRSRNPQIERRIKVNSTQTAPLTLSMSEGLLWKALQAVNHGLESKKRELDDRFRNDRGLDGPHSHHDALDINLGVINNLGPAYSHAHRKIRSSLVLFQDSEPRDCTDFLLEIENYLIRLRNEADANINTMDDLEFRVVELKGVGWAVREPAAFTIGPSASYGRRTIQAALDRIQTGIGDVIRGHNIAIHITAQKRGHLVLDKVIVAHEKHGGPRITFVSPEQAELCFISRLKSRIQTDIDMVFEDSCSIDDIPEDEEDDFVQPSSKGACPPGYSPSSRRSSSAQPSSRRSSSAQRSETTPGGTQNSPGLRPQRSFSFSRSSVESLQSINRLKAGQDPFMDGTGRAAAGEENLKALTRVKPVPEERALPITVAQVKPAHRSFSLVSRKPSSSAVRVSTASTLVEEQATNVADSPASWQDHGAIGTVRGSAENRNQEIMTSEGVEMNPMGPQSRNFPAEVSLGLDNDAVSQPAKLPSRNDDSRDAPSTLSQIAKSKMDTPETFQDAREFAVTPASEAIEKAEPASGWDRGASPRDEYEFSTAPATPELSTGGSSPRHSLLITPVYVRTNSATRDPGIRGFHTESEPEQPDLDFGSEIAASQTAKENRDDVATDEPPIGQASLSAPSQPMAAVMAAPEGADGRFDVTNLQGSSGSSVPTAALAFHHEASNAESTSTPIPFASSASESSSESITKGKPTRDDLVDSTKFGVESNTETEAGSRGPDFPAPEVRRSDPNHASVCDSVPESETFARPDNKVDAPREAHVDEADGNELGTAVGAEVKFAEDHMSGGNPVEMSETLPGFDSEQYHGGELEAVPSDFALGGGSFRQEVEQPPGDDGHKGTEKDEALRSNNGPKTTAGTGSHVGGDGGEGGPELVTDEQEKEQSAPKDAIQNVHPAEDRMPEYTAKEEHHGPDSDTAAAFVEPGGSNWDKTAETVDLDRLVNPFKSEQVSWEPGAGPAQAAGESEQQTDSRLTGPTGTRAEGTIDVPVGRDPAAEGSDLGIRHAENDYAAGAEGQDAAPAPRATASELSDGNEGREDGSAMAPTVGEAAGIGSLGRDVSEEAPGRAFCSSDSANGAELADINARTGSDACPEVPRADGADGLETQADGGIDGMLFSEGKVLRTETGEEECSRAVGPDQGLPELVADNETTGAGSGTAPEPLPEVFEGQRHNLAEKEAYGSDKVPEFLAEMATTTGDGSQDRRSGREVGSDERGKLPEEESYKLDTGQDISTDSEIPRPKSPIEHAVAPAIPPEDLTMSLPDASAPSAHADARNVSASMPAVPTELESAAPETAEEGPHLAPIPDITKLFPSHPHISSSSSFFSSPDDNGSLVTARGSVDTMRPSTDEHGPRTFPAPEPTRADGRPKTAGYLGLGLRESRFVEVGLRGALGDRRARRLSLPSRHVADEEGPNLDLDGSSAAAAGKISGGGPASEAGNNGRSRLRKRRMGNNNTAKQHEAGESAESGDGDGAQGTLPKMMMFLAGAVAIGKIMRGLGPSA